jgi:putative transposase
MANYVRQFQPGGTFFLTLVTESRAPIFVDESARKILNAAIERCRSYHAFSLDAIVLLPEHLHLLITLPKNDSEFSLRIRNIKYSFTRAYLNAGGAEQSRSVSRQRRRIRGVWQRRFWEHTIRDSTDLNNHFDYIHYNPVKHEHVSCPHAWPHSSFHRFVADGRYEHGWQCQCDGRKNHAFDFDEIAQSVGE